MTTPLDQTRAEFEAYLRDKYPWALPPRMLAGPDGNPSDQYAGTAFQFAWEAWQAAIASRAAPLTYPPLPAARIKGFPGGLDGNEMRPAEPDGFHADQMRAYVDADRAARATTPSPPVAAPPATPAAPAEALGAPEFDASVPDEVRRIYRSHVRESNAAQPQPAQLLTGTPEFEFWWADHCPNATQAEAWVEWCALHPAATASPMPRRALLDMTQCYSDRESFGRAVERWHGITAPSTPTPPEVAP